MAKPKNKAKRRGLSAQELRSKYSKQRSELTKLKAKGLISPRANLRKAKPSSALLKKLEVLRPVLEGKAQVVKLPSKNRRDYKDAGFATSNGFTVIRTNPNERVIVNDRGMPEVIERKIKNGPAPSGFKRVILPVNMRRFDKFYEWITNRPDELETMGGGPGTLFAFTYFGHNSHEIMSAAGLAAYLQHYTALFPKGDGTENEVEHAFKHLEIYSMDLRGAVQFSLQPRKKEARGMKFDATGRSVGYDKHKEYRAKVNHIDTIEKFRASEAARKRAYRAKRKREFEV